MTGYMKSSLAAAIYTSFDGNLREFKQELPNLYQKKFADKSTTFMIGPVPFTLGFEGTGSIGLEAQFSANVNYAVKFVGMYGGGVDLSVSYGCERWYKPWTWYVTPSVRGRLINNTEYYVGPVTQDIGGGNSYGGHVIFKPAIKLTPSIAVGPEYAYAGVGIPVNVYFNGGIGLYNKASQLEEAWFMIKEEFIAAYNLYGRLGLGTTVSVEPKLGVKIPLINKKIEHKFSAIPLLDAEVFVNNKHQFETK